MAELIQNTLSCRFVLKQHNSSLPKNTTNDWMFYLDARGKSLERNSLYLGTCAQKGTSRSSETEFPCTDPGTPNDQCMTLTINRKGRKSKQQGQKLQKYLGGIRATIGGLRLKRPQCQENWVQSRPLAPGINPSPPSETHRTEIVKQGFHKVDIITALNWRHHDRRVFFDYHQPKKFSVMEQTHGLEIDCIQSCARKCSNPEVWGREPYQQVRIRDGGHTAHCWRNCPIYL